MFRIFQEILINVARHSRDAGRHRASRPESVALDVADNGVGITDGDMSGKKSLGLLGMHERALLFGGDVKISGSASNGTRVSVSIPLKGKS